MAKAKMTHTPTAAMQAAAKRGLETAKGKDGVDETRLAAGRKIASGRALSIDHVNTIFEYHAGHVCNQSDADCMLMGGPPGAQWSAARSAATSAATLSADADPAVSMSLSDMEDVSFEIFLPGETGAETMLGEDGLIWAPILRSGTLAVRPGPRGEKIHEPLVFVPGLATDTRKEIGLQNLVDSFDAGAVQHVTIPSTHDNDVLSNTGYIRALKIVDSKTVPGQKVLMGAHDFTEPEVKGKVERGTVANRSCGILYDYVDTDTGTCYPQVLEHVALTNKPWVRGMTAYGEVSEDDFSDRQVIPMMLSDDGGVHLADSGASDSAWDGSAGRFTDEQYQRSCLIDRKNGKPAKERCSLPVCEPDGTLNKNAVHSAAGMISKLGDVTSEQKRAAAKSLIALYKKIDEKPPINLVKMSSASTKMSEREVRADLNLADVMWGNEPSLNSIRGQLVEHFRGLRTDGQYGAPYYSVMDLTTSSALVCVDYDMDDDCDDNWVVPFSIGADGTVVVSDFSQWTPVTQEWVKDEDADQDKTETQVAGGVPLADTDESRRLQLSQEHKTNQQGGAMTPTTAEVLARLNLSEEEKAVFQKLSDDNTRLATQLADVTKASRQERITARVKELQEAKFPPGFLKAYEAIALSDDGQVATVLHLSEGGSAPTKVEQTATQIADRLIAALPRDESGRLALADKATLLENPLTARPPATVEEQEKIEGKDKKPQTGDELAAMWAEAAPELAHTLNLSNNGGK